MKVLREGKVAGFANHTAFIVRDGTDDQNAFHAIALEEIVIIVDRMIDFRYKMLCIRRF
jgi:hypothetical protein